MQPTLAFSEMNIPMADPGTKSALPALLDGINTQNRHAAAIEDGEDIHIGYGQRPSAYPYTQRQGYTRVLKEGTVRTAVLENDFLRAVFLPDLGGRLWRLTDKASGRELVYTNDVLRYSDLAVTGAWFSGGIEWNVGVIGHSPFTTEPLYAAQTRLPSGAPVLRMYEYERVRRVCFQMDFWLEAADRFLNCRMRIENTNEETIPMYWWSNIAVSEEARGRIAVPASSAYTHNTGGDICKISVPLPDGTDITHYRKTKFPVDYFFDIPSQRDKYIAAFCEDGFGLLQRSTSRLAGRKLFSWGHVQSSGRWQAFLTQNAGPYLEIQAGLGKTQYGCVPMPGKAVWEWLEQYGAMRITPRTLRLPFAPFIDAVSQSVWAGCEAACLEKVLQKTADMASAPAALRYAASGYGALEKARRAQGKKPPLPSHLAFTRDPSLAFWENWFGAKPYEMPDPRQAPGAFLCGDDIAAALEESANREDGDNWFILYHAGVCGIAGGHAEKAVAYLLRSLSAAQSAWAYHALSCAYIRLAEYEKAREAMGKGIRLCGNDPCYLTDAFRILLLAGFPEDVKSLWEALPDSAASNTRLRFCRIEALARTGEEKAALEMLMADGGFVPDDIHEGDASLGLLYQDLHEKVYGERPKIPPTLNFGMSP